MQNPKDLREARRKRILERGSDRLAFITGESKLALKPTPSRAEVSSVESSKDGFERRFHEQNVEHMLTSSSEAFEYTEGALSVEQNEDGFERRLQEQTIKFRPATAKDTFENIEEITAVKPAKNGFERRFEEQNIEPKPASSTGLSSIQDPDGVTRKESQIRTDGINIAKKKYPIINVKYLRESIDRTQDIRALMAMLIAIVVAIQNVLFSCGNPWGSILSIWLLSWPISLILLTDVWVIIVALISRSQLEYKQEETMNSVYEEGDGAVNKFSKAISALGHFQEMLNVGLLLKQAANAVSLDCSIYVVVLICSLNLGQHAFSC